MHAGQAVDVLYLAETTGAPLAPSRVAEVISALVDAASLPADLPGSTTTSDGDVL